ncbi:glycosyltransferase family 2 protein [Candidatus Pelagibacter bacterium]|nr:glycosyltransferase family 2 protein [Candidatus Pelagibacter bacterium]
MKILTILLPLYNDWKSLYQLLYKINNQFKNKLYKIKIIVVNDNSSEKYIIRKKNYKNINSIKIINLKKNVGNQKAIYVGLNHILNKNKQNGIIIVMDADGEDDQSKLKLLIKKVEKESDFIIFVKRSKRLETFLLRILNQFRLLVTLILTGNYMNFGNYSAFESKHLKKLLSNKNLSIAYCSGVLKNFKNVDFIYAKKKKRYFGVSKANFSFLIKHSLNLISLFYKRIFFISLILNFIYFGIIFENSFFDIALITSSLLFNIMVIINYYKNIFEYQALSLIKNIKQIY